MKKLPKKLIKNIINNGHNLLVACTYTNNSVFTYLTNQSVAREEYGYVEDPSEDDPKEVIQIDLPKITWSTTKRLQRTLINLINS